jgi:thiosulfate dehydrogenase
MPSNNIRPSGANALARAHLRLASRRSSRLALHFASIAIGAAWTALQVIPGIAEGVVAPGAPIWTVPEVGALPDNEHGRLVRRGRDLITATYAHIGPEVADAADRYAGNNLACGNCHLEAGTKKFALPIFGLFGEYPRYNARTAEEITIEGRVNGCMERSMNGRAMPLQAQQMLAIVAYVKFLSTGVPPGQELPGLGVGKMPELDRAADPARGRPIYANTCAVCHGPDGLGVRRSLPTVDLGYMMPPLWGSDSFNDGAGMARLITAANFIHFNMPHGADYLHPQLTVEDAWDVAAYLESQPRPHKEGLDRDYPDLLQKPVDTPYGPYADGFGEQQHKYGPFAPIRAALARLKAKDGGRKTDDGSQRTKNRE